MNNFKALIENVVSNRQLVESGVESALLKKGVSDNLEDRIEAASHRLATDRVLLNALNDPSPSVRHAAVTNPNASKNFLHKAISSDDHHTAFTALSHPNVDKFLCDYTLDKLEHAAGALKARMNLSGKRFD